MDDFRTFDSKKACELSKYNKIKNKIKLLSEEEFTDYINVIVSIKESCYDGEDELLIGENTQLHKCLTPEIIEILKLKGFNVFKEYDRNVLYSPGPYLGYLISW